MSLMAKEQYQKWINKVEEGEQLKQKFINDCTKLGADKNVIAFIADIRFHNVFHVEIDKSVETIRSLFEAGYCYYFAKMLEDVFPGGVICCCYPFSHIVYVYQRFAYDIGGISNAEYDMHVPIVELGDFINDFRHLPDTSAGIDEDQFARIGTRVKQNHTFVEALNWYDAKERLNAMKLF